MILMSSDPAGPLSKRESNLRFQPDFVKRMNGFVCDGAQADMNKARQIGRSNFRVKWLEIIHPILRFVLGRAYFG